MGAKAYGGFEGGGVQMDEQNFAVRKDERLIDEASNHCLLLLAYWPFFLHFLVHKSTVAN